MTYKSGSLFDGSGGFPLAGALCGIEPVWAAEVEPYPIAVTRSRFPTMRHLGDISKVKGSEIELVDIVTFGSPCQDLSVAGKRAGLKHEANGDEETTRSGLFMEAVRIIKEMRDATYGLYPRFALWENVPGAFSSNSGEDFRTVLEELIKIVEPRAVMPEVPKAGWAYADSYSGDGWSLAYRVFDAQYWGVPQRRRRIHLVLDLRGERAREVLFEREGVRGCFTQGPTTRQGIAADAEGSTGAEGRSCFGGRLDAVTDANILDDQGMSVINTRTDGKSPTLRAQIGGHPPVVLQAVQNTGQGWWNESPVAQTLRTPCGGDSTKANLIIMQNQEAPLFTIRRLTPTECARLQGFADRWGNIDQKDSFTAEELQFWMAVRNTHASINGKDPKEYTEAQMLTWYSRLHTDSSEYKMWGNGIALPPALYCMQGMTDVLTTEEEMAHG